MKEVTTLSFNVEVILGSFIFVVLGALLFKSYPNEGLLYLPLIGLVLFFSNRWQVRNCNSDIEVEL